MADKKDEKKDFVVKDRRIFAGENRDEAGTEEEQTPAAQEDQESDSAEASEAATEQQPEPPPQFPEINFATFVASLNASALLQLGAIEDPSTGQKNKNLPMAKQTIDILSMLQDKTAGNLSEEEGNLLKNILYDLRIMYVKEKQ